VWKACDKGWTKFRDNQRALGKLAHGYFGSERVKWPLSHAAQSCFDSDTWPRDVPVPQGWLEFDVEDVSTATETLKKLGYRLLVEAREEPWGQIVTRLLTPEGLLLGITYTPSLRR
jgi:hypothetical protein